MTVMNAGLPPQHPEEFVLLSAQEAAVRTINESEVLNLRDEARERFV